MILPFLHDYIVQKTFRKTIADSRKDEIMRNRIGSHDDVRHASREAKQRLLNFLL